MILAALGLLVFAARRPSLDAKLDPVLMPASSSSPLEIAAPSATHPRPAAGAGAEMESAARALIRLRAAALGGDARAAWNAFQIADFCATPERERSALHDLPIGMSAALRPSLEPEADADAKLCSGVTALQRGERRAYLLVAADGGVPGAAAALFDFGPSDRAPDDDPADPEVKTWREHTLALLRRDAERGDIGALTALQAVYEYGGIAAANPAQALTYELAVQGLMAADAQFVPAELDLHRESIARIESLLPADERLAAQAAAADLLARCCDRRITAPLPPHSPPD